MNNFHEGDIFHERYKLIKYLGGGELSEVWQVHDQLADIEVALKIYIRVGEVGIRQFIKDFTLTESLNHPYILKPHHVDVFDRRPYLILRYCSLGSVSNRIDESSSNSYKPFDERDIAIFMVQIGGALNYLHQNHILHKDVKPDNILIADNGEFLLTDFGISKKVQTTFAKATSSTQVISFSRPYAPPEILIGSEEPRKDIFSLGVTMYELITEELPFEGNGGTALLMGAGIPDLPNQFSSHLNAILKKCMSKDVELRPTAQDIENYGRIFLNTGNWPIIRNNDSESTKEDFLSKTKHIYQNFIQGIYELLPKNLNQEIKSHFQNFKLPIYIIGGLIVAFILGFLFFKKYSNPAKPEVTRADSTSLKTESNENGNLAKSTLLIDKKYESLMKQAEASFEKKDYKNTLKLTSKAWKVKNNEDAKLLYIKADKAFNENVTSENKKNITKADIKMKNGDLESALSLYKAACANHPDKECKAKINNCISKMSNLSINLIQQGKIAIDNNKSKAKDLFRQARNLADAGGFSTSQFADLYQYYIKRADRLYENEEYQDAKQWYQIAQSLQNSHEVQQKILLCNNK